MNSKILEEIAKEQFDEGHGAPDSYGPKEIAFFFVSQAIKASPEEHSLLFTRGFINYKLGNFQDAVEDCSAALKLDPSFIRAYEIRGRSFCELGNYEEAIADSTQAINMGTRDSDTFNSRGIAYFQIGRVGEAVRDITLALEINPSNDRLYSNLGWLLTFKGDYYGGLVNFSRAIDLNPNCCNPYYFRGKVLELLGRDEEARSDFLKVVGFNPSGQYGHSIRAEALEFLGRLEEAIPNFTEITKNHPKDPLAWFNLGATLKKLGWYINAINALSTAIDLTPSFLQAFSCRGDAYRLQGYSEEAKKDYKKAISLFLAKQNKWKGDYESAIRAERGLRRVERLENDSIEQEALQKGIISERELAVWFRNETK